MGACCDGCATGHGCEGEKACCGPCSQGLPCGCGDLAAKPLSPAAKVQIQPERRLRMGRSMGGGGMGFGRTVGATLHNSENGATLNGAELPMQIKVPAAGQMQTRQPEQPYYRTPDGRLMTAAPLYAPPVVPLTTQQMAANVRGPFVTLPQVVYPAPGVPYLPGGAVHTNAAGCCGNTPVRPAGQVLETASSMSKYVIPVLTVVAVGAAGYMAYKRYYADPRAAKREAELVKIRREIAKDEVKFRAIDRQIQREREALSDEQYQALLVREEMMRQQWRNREDYRRTSGRYSGAKYRRS